MSQVKPEFERTADTTLETVRAIYSQRGAEYQDTWALENQNPTFTQHILREVFGVVDPIPEAVRLLVMAALVDVKDSRMIGPYKHDTLVDGIAYRAAFAQMYEEYQQSASPSTL